MDVLVGIDLGTSGLKAAVFGLDGALLGQGRAANEYVPGPAGWAEQEPRSWWAGCCRAVQEALAEAATRSAVSAVEVAAVGVCGFHHCPVLLDAQGEPVRPTVVTHDSRLGESLAKLDRDGILEEMVQITGSRIMTGHFPPIYRLLQRQDPRGLEKAASIVLAKDYLRFRLTGEIGTELCDATGTHLIAMPEAEWSQSLCTLLGVPRDRLPGIGRSSQVAGHVTAGAARSTGLRQGIPVVYGGGDSHCALAGLGVIGTGEAGLLLGSNSTLRASFDSPVRAIQHVVWSQQHVIPERFTVSASSMAGSSVLTWFKDLFYDSAKAGGISYADLASQAAEVPPGSDGLFFHPYLFGERSPFYNPKARAAFLGIRHWHGRGHLARSVMEGVAYSIANCFDAIQDIATAKGGRIGSLRIGQGGGSRLAHWRQMIADVLALPLDVVGVEEPGCLGAALLAGVGVGIYPDMASAVGQTVHVQDRVVPDPDVTTAYGPLRARFNQAYRALEPILYSQVNGEMKG